MQKRPSFQFTPPIQNSITANQSQLQAKENLMLLISLFQIIVPLFFIAIIILTRQPDRLQWGLSALAYGIAIGFMWLSARWDIVSIYWRILFPSLYLVAVIISYRRIQIPEKPPSKIQYLFSLFMMLFVIVLMSGLSWRVLLGYAVPDNTLELVSPLRDGRYIVGQGGGSPFINGHFHVRPQSYALDILGLNSLGLSADAFSDGSVLENYAIFGVTVYSPCAGTVLTAVDQFADLTPPNTDTQNLAGNHILLACGDAEVLLAHLKQGSVQVAASDTVTTDTVLAQVGNTGNTSEPHLHIHAEQGGLPGLILNGEAVPITINGRFLVRGNILTQP
jgi:hypothetical protein